MPNASTHTLPYLSHSSISLSLSHIVLRATELKVPPSSSLSSKNSGEQKLPSEEEQLREATDRRATTSLHYIKRMRHTIQVSEKASI